MAILLKIGLSISICIAAGSDHAPEEGRLVGGLVGNFNRSNGMGGNVFLVLFSVEKRTKKDF